MKSRNTKSILQNNMGTTSKEVNADLTLPKILWDIDKLSKYPSRLGELSDKKLALDKINESISLEKQTLLRELKSLGIQSKKKISSYRSDLEREKYIKESEFKERKIQVEESKLAKVESTIEELTEQKETILAEFERKYKEDLDELMGLYQQIDQILEEYKVRVDSHSIENYDGDWNEITTQDLKQAIRHIKGEMDYVFNNGMTINKAWDKIRNFDDKQNKLVGAGVLATAVMAAPVALVGSAVTIGVTLGQNKKVTDKLAEHSIKLIQLQRIIEYKYKKRKEDDSIDLSYLDRDMNEIYESSEKQANRELEQILEEERLWNEEYKRKLDYNFEREETLKYENEVKIKTSNSDARIASLNEFRTKTESELKIMKNNLESINTIPPIKNDLEKVLFEKIKEIKDINNNFLKLEILERLNFKKREEFEEKYGNDIPPELMRQIDYDEALYHEDFLPLKEKVEMYETTGVTKDVAEKMLKQAYLEETPLYLLDTNKLHLGQLTKLDKYMNLEDSEELFANGWNNSSVLFVYKTEEEEKILINYVKYLLFQCMGMMHPQALEINILNPTMDSKFNDILINTTIMKRGKEEKSPPYSTNYSGSDMTTLIEKQKAIVNQRYRDMLVGDKVISDIVRERRESGSKVPKYVINVLHRTEINSPIYNLSENSSIHGIINFALVDYNSLVGTDSDGEPNIPGSIKNQFKKDKIIVEVATILDDNESVLNIFQKNNSRYRQVKYRSLKSHEIEDYRAFMDNRYKEALNRKTITRIDEYIDQLIGKDFWSASARETVQLYFGYVDGDKSKQYPVVIDEEAKVHAFMGGTTGGGKSVTLNAVVEVLKAMYPPSELDIYYYDFKKVEIANHIKPYKWPNAKAMSASETGDYLISLMNDIVEEMNTRYANMEAVGASKLSKYQEYLEEKKAEFIAAGDFETANKIKIPARTLIIIDEVQQAFTINDDVTEKFKEAVEDIARLARAAGLHMFFVSQDPGNKIPGNVMDLFTIRACTKATPAVSSAVLRNNFAALPENQFIGFLGVNTSPTGDDEENIQYVVPLSEESDARLYSKITHDLAEASTEESGNRPQEAVIFSDNDKYSFKMLEDYLRDNETEIGEIILGDAVEYQKKYEPAKIKLERGQLQGVSFISVEEEYKVDFVRTALRSINQRNAGVLTFFGGDYDPHYDLENRVKKHVIVDNVYYDTKQDRYIEEFEERKELDEKMAEFEKNWDYYLSDKASTERKIKEAEEMIANGQVQKDEETTWEEYKEELERKYKNLKRENNVDGENLLERYELRTKNKYYYQTEEYGERPIFANKDNDDSMVGQIQKYLGLLIDRNKALRREGKEAIETYILAIDPEKDPYVMQDNAWKDKGFQQLVNEASTNGIFFITVTSNFSRVADADFNRYVMGIKPGQEASYEKIFKNPVGDFVQLWNKVDPPNSFKFKMATDKLVTLMPWEK